MSPCLVLLVLGIVNLVQLCVPQASCPPISPRRWLRDHTLDDLAPSPDSSSVLDVLSHPDRLACIQACTLLTSCLSVVVVEAQGQCLLLARPFSTLDISSGDLIPHPGAHLFNDVDNHLCWDAPGYTMYWGLGRCLKFHPELLSWEAARATCLQEGADLAKAENSTVRGLIASHKYNGVVVWVGATCFNDTWVWLDTTPVEEVEVEGSSACAARGGIWTANLLRYISPHNERPFMCQI